MSKREIDVPPIESLFDAMRRENCEISIHADWIPTMPYMGRITIGIVHCLEPDDPKWDSYRMYGATGVSVKQMEIGEEMMTTEGILLTTQQVRHLRNQLNDMLGEGGVCWNCKERIHEPRP